MSLDGKNYYLKEWENFLADDSRAKNLLSAAKGLKIKNVLDIGCGAGQECLPFAEKGANCFGVDVWSEGQVTGKKLFAERGLKDKINFLQGRGENLPFAKNSFQIVICRIALPYMNNRKVLAEAEAVLSNDGIFFLKIHAPKYYFALLNQRLKSGNPISLIYPLRVLINGFLYQVTGRQFSGKLTAGGEIFQTRKSLERALNAANLKIKSEMPDTNSQTPSYLIVKKNDELP